MKRCPTCGGWPTVEHHALTQSSVAKCWGCGRTASPYHWPAQMPGHDAYIVPLEIWDAETEP